MNTRFVTHRTLALLPAISLIIKPTSTFTYMWLVEYYTRNLFNFRNCPKFGAINNDIKKKKTETGFFYSYARTVGLELWVGNCRASNRMLYYCWMFFLTVQVTCNRNINICPKSGCLTRRKT